MAEAKPQQDHGDDLHQSVSGEAKDGMAVRPMASGGAGGAEDHATSGDAGHSLGNFEITHYTFALESDPKHANSPKVSAPGLPADKKYKQSFLGSPYGIKMQGTGLADDGHYIQYTGNGHYKYGVGGAAGAPSAWKTVAVDPRVIHLGSKLQIDIYKGKGDFTAKDTGGAIKGKHIDVFAGAIPIAQAYALGTKHSIVRLLDGNHKDPHPGGQQGGGAGGGGGTTKPAQGGHHITSSVGKGGKNTDKDVRAVQARLKTRGIDCGTVDGDCGAKTIHAIEQFQSTFMDHPDGLISPGHGTEKHLFEENGVVHPRGAQGGGKTPDKGGGGSKDAGSGSQDKHAKPDGQQHEEGPASYKDIAKNFNAAIPGSAHFKWHEALYLPSWGRHANASEVSDTILGNIQRQAHALDKVADHFGSSIVVHCWLRPTAYNKQIGGASNSAHLRGGATDFHIPGKTAEQVRQAVKNTKGLYPGAGENNVSWVHLDLEHKAWFNP